MSTTEMANRAASPRSGLANPSIRTRISRATWTTGVLVAFTGLLVVCGMASVGIGMVPMSPGQVLAILASRVGVSLPWSFSA